MSLPGKVLNKFLDQLSYVKRLQSRVHNYENFISFPPGHYYSAIVDPNEYIEHRKMTETSKSSFSEIALNEKAQLSLLKDFENVYSEPPFSAKKVNGFRYYYDNDFFSYSDALGLYCMIRHFKPFRIIEIGSGFSSALILDTNDIFFNSKIELTFIDPYPERLKSLLKTGENVNIIEKKIQQVNLEIFQSLNEGDFLLIDTSHVSKSGSDVNHIYFNILPLLNKGVRIHIHDIFFPFEYPDKWIIDEKRSWNELYLLRAFLTCNTAFEITYFNSFMEEKYRQYISDRMPLFLERSNTVCGGIWIKKNV